MTEEELNVLKQILEEIKGLREDIVDLMSEEDEEDEEDEIEEPDDSIFNKQGNSVD